MYQIAMILAAAVVADAAPDSVEWVCREHPARIEALFAALDVEHPGMDGVRGAVEHRTWPETCAALLDYYRDSDTASWLRDPKPSGGADVIAQAEQVLDDTFTFYDVTGTVPRTAAGGLAWSSTGPNDDREWAWALNRHYHLDWLLQAFLATKDTVYAAAYDSHVRDWILSNPYPGTASNTSAWRGLEAHFRVLQWAKGFYALQDVDALTPATRILMLSSIPEHAHYLRHFHKQSSNWIAMELNALAGAAVSWPEFREAEAWFEYASHRLTEELTEQVYPDGAQNELTSHYHYVTLLNFDDFAATAARAGRPVPPLFHETRERMWDYLAYTMRPDGYGLLNNDSDRDFNRERVRRKAEEFERPDWAYIATNGAEGSIPAQGPSVFFPWAGHLVMRDGWEKESQWAFFDIGPMGTGHYHYDKLHLSVAAGGRDLLVDGGRYTYVGGAWRDYFTGSPSHNVLLVDGNGQNRFAHVTTSPLDQQVESRDDYDFAWGVFTDGYRDVDDTIEHTRMLYYARSRYWLVLDRFRSEKPHSVQALWHFHPACDVRLDGDTVWTQDDAVNLTVTPDAAAAWQATLVKGQEEPLIQGWWSREYNHKEPAFTAVYEMKVEGTAVWAWLLVPHDGLRPSARLHLTPNADETVSVTLDIDQQSHQLVFTWPPNAAIRRP